MRRKAHIRARAICIHIRRARTAARARDCRCRSQAPGCALTVTGRRNTPRHIQRTPTPGTESAKTADWAKACVDLRASRPLTGPGSHREGSSDRWAEPSGPRASVRARRGSRRGLRDAGWCRVGATLVCPEPGALAAVGAHLFPLGLVTGLPTDGRGNAWCGCASQLCLLARN